MLATIPTPGSITAEEQIESIDAVKWTLSNGITVIAKQTDFRNDEVVFRSFSPGGHSLVSDDDHVSALHAAQLVSESGAGPHNSVTLDKLLAGMRVSVSPYIGELFEGFGGSASPEDMETLFQLITLYSADPRGGPSLLLELRVEAAQRRRVQRRRAGLSPFRYPKRPAGPEPFPCPSSNGRTAGRTEHGAGPSGLRGSVRRLERFHFRFCGRIRLG